MRGVSGQLSVVSCQLSVVSCQLLRGFPYPHHCHLSPALFTVTCHLSPVTCHLSPEITEGQVELLHPMSVVSGQLSVVSCQLLRGFPYPHHCHLSPALFTVTCHLSPVTCHLSPEITEGQVELLHPIDTGHHNRQYVDY